MWLCPVQGPEGRDEEEGLGAYRSTVEKKPNSRQSRFPVRAMVFIRVRETKTGWVGRQEEEEPCRDSATLSDSQCSHLDYYWRTDAPLPSFTILRGERRKLLSY